MAIALRSVSSKSTKTIKGQGSFSALAESIFLELNYKGMTTLVSTHYMALKTLAQTDSGFLNMCAEFDLETLSS